MSTDIERIASLEQRLLRVEQDIREVKDCQALALDKIHESTLEDRDLKSELGIVLDALQLHQTWHDKQSEKKYKWTDIILALGMLALTFLMLIKQ